MQKTLFELKCAVQNYAWGKRGADSTVAQLLIASDEKIKEDLPYAELWMGTHVSGPSHVVLPEGKVLLKEYLSNNIELLSKTPEDLDASELQGNLAYLFKVLSVNQALSIQAHPNKALAKQLHSNFPDLYKDDNHKPEMSLAITDFEALVGFQSLNNIFFNIKHTPELLSLLSSTLQNSSFETLSETNKLRLLFTTLMRCNTVLVQKQLHKLITRLNTSTQGSEEGILSQSNELAVRLFQQYPSDIGIFCSYFLNYKRLKAGEAVFLAANEPHAYLSGDCIEIMATSDNVVRAGLTPKARDVDTLCEMLNYNTKAQNVATLLGTETVSENEGSEFSVKLYVPNDDEVTEFQVERIQQKDIVDETTSDENEVAEIKLRPSSYGSILIVISGNRCEIVNSDTNEKVPCHKGSVLFQGAGSNISILTNTQNFVPEEERERLIIFRATKKNALLS